MNSSDVLKRDMEVFEITRRTARAGGLSWCGTFFFVTGLLGLSYVFFDQNYNQCLKLDVSKYFELLRKLNIDRTKPLTGVEVFRFSVFITLFFVIAIVLWVASIKAQRGTISFYKDKILCRCERSFVDLMPGQISSVRRNGNIVKITYLASTLTIKSEKASQIADRVQGFINVYSYSGNQKVNDSTAVTVNADKIREYKQLVDDGIITKEQFDEIIRKFTKA